MPKAKNPHQSGFVVLNGLIQRRLLRRIIVSHRYDSDDTEIKAMKPDDYLKRGLILLQVAERQGRGVFDFF